MKLIKNTRLFRVGVIAGISLVGFGILGIILSALGTRYIRAEVERRAALYGRTIDIENISILSPGKVSLFSVTVEHPQGKNASIEKIVIDYSLQKLLSGNLVLSKILVKNPKFSFQKNQDGIDTLSDLLQPRQITSSGEEAEKRPSRFSEADLVIEGGSTEIWLSSASGESHLFFQDLFLDLPAHEEGVIRLGKTYWGEQKETPEIKFEEVTLKVDRDGKKLRLVDLRLDQPEFTLRREGFFGLPLAPWRELLRARNQNTALSTTANSLPLSPKSSDFLTKILQIIPNLEVVNGTIHLEDRSGDNGGFRLTIDEVDFHVSKADSDSQPVLGNDFSKLLFRASGGTKTNEQAGWSAEGDFDISQQTLSVRFGADNVGMRRFTPYLEGAQFVDPDTASMNFDVLLQYQLEKEIYVGGMFTLEGLTIDHPKLASSPIPDVSLSLEGELTYDSLAQSLSIVDAQIRRKHAEIHFDATVQKKEEGTVYQIHAKMPPTHCGKLFASIPPELIPVLEDFKLDGTFSFDIELDMDTQNLSEISLEGDLDLNRCKVISSGPKVKVSVGNLKSGSFTQRVKEKDGSVTSFLVGAESSKWTTLDEISPYMIKAILTTEDGAFFSHKGFITLQVLRSLVENLEAGTFRRGASTITMQLVKNTLLNREKTISRKLQEMVLTWWVEQNISKERILELYFNLIEFGPKMYGIHDATHHYFSSKPSEINPWQAAFLVSIIPNPKKHYYMFKKNEVGPRWTSRVRRILTIMHQKERLTDAEYAAVQEVPIVFGKSEEFSTSLPTSLPQSQPVLEPELEPEEEAGKDLFPSPFDSPFD